MKALQKFGPLAAFMIHFDFSDQNQRAHFWKIFPSLADFWWLCCMGLPWWVWII